MGELNLFEFVNIFGTSFSVISIVAAAAGIVLSSLWAFRPKKTKHGDRTETLYEQARIDEVSDALKTNKFVARWAGFTNGLLLFGQIVMGGTLASQFLQDHVDKNITGSLGLLVLVSSLVHQTFRPDLLKRGSRRRMILLQNLARNAEDAVFRIEQSDPQAEKITTIRQRVSERLGAIEGSEVEELPGERRIGEPAPLQIPSVPSEIKTNENSKAAQAPLGTLQPTS